MMKIRARGAYRGNGPNGQGYYRRIPRAGLTGSPSVRTIMQSAEEKTSQGLLDDVQAAASRA
jgi:hypothetical protein